MTAEIAPAELGLLLDYAERPRVGDWSLRAALTRYAQPQPQRASDLIEVMRRIELGLHPHLKEVQRNGEEYWEAVGGDGPRDDSPVDAPAVSLLRLMAEMDRLGDVLAGWAVSREGGRPDGAVDEMIANGRSVLDELGVAHEERVRPAGAGGRPSARRTS